MTRLLTVFLSALAAVGFVSAQASPNARTAVDKTREYFNEALALKAQTEEIGTLSCVEYSLNMGPYTKIVPTLERIKGIFDAYKQIVNFQPPLNLTIPEEADAGDDIVYFLGVATFEIGTAFDRMTETGTANLCTLPMLGTKIKKALQDVKAVSRPFYFSLAAFHLTETGAIRRLFLSFESNIEAAIQVYSSPIPV
ncbi:hypothetical protein QC764_106263 [Podospora pseudoanserina]|uniref:Uncharacterized protein n=1 Tax=Podospora pseudoanserina TaxID=2609844 RepID=A0ABR0IMD1_9PEZI|nr:hypothetical protein QC764_106263 [Podospora pseudoanserina]